MRILHVSEVQWGGVVSLIHQFAGAQVAGGDDVLLLTPAAFPALASVPMERWRLNREEPTTYLRAYRQLHATVARFRPDVIHLHSFVAGFFGRLPGAVLGTPVVYQPHAWSFDLREEWMFQQSVRTWERSAGRRSAMVVTNCQDEIDEGRSAGVVAPAVSIGVAIDPVRFQPVSDDERAVHRRATGVTRPRMLLCIGRLARQKGQDELVRAWERRPLPDTELVLLGPGDTTALAATAPVEWGRSIRAVGGQVDVRPWIWAADALVLSSRYETVALAIAETMSCGRPVVATSVNGAREVLVDGALPAAGRVVPLGEMDALLDAALSILEDPAGAEVMAQAGRARALELFDPSVVVQRLAGAYRRATVLSRGETAIRGTAVARTI